MKNNIVFGKIEMGIVIPDNEVYQDMLSKGEGKEVKVEIGPNDIKSQKQLGYLFGVVFKLVGDHRGTTPEETYQDVLAAMPEYGRYYKEVNGKMKEYKRGLSGMSREEVSRFIDAVLLFFRTNETTREIDIPDPDPFYYIDKK
jgi:hypothetical protein